ncbi:CobW family GTP-binding protein [Prochlorococcus marinus]|uniref:Cobalamin biosynthesis protein CobW n=1 Tax=Prochlorococcus marinus XMU1408 TaxID=2213228 RepID=A0A318R154_PROMR|nr:GTP-binding protein [Prochlorococcus marinus]MBW3041517.1 cobalamin biosynthesis protein CobW [Prochlorococcus marinus str. XMU1408]PYE02675.1 cobalamin biosynthesis protein CobW [Prochlorococcus marinus XMU1408]
MNKSESNSKEKIISKTNIPITIISGFLGSGKTTLLNHILTNQKGIKTAVLVNEFGEIGIDNELIIKTEEEMIELTNGCICCSINGELVGAIEKLIKVNKKIDYIIIETTGLADPLPVAMTLLGSELRDKTRLDSIITLIDAENFNDVALESSIGRSQIIYGDILLLNKCDLVTNENIEETITKLKEIKNDARILKSIKGNIPLNLLLSVGLFEIDLINQKESGHDNHGHAHKHHDHQHSHKHHDHSKKDDNQIEDFISISFQVKEPFSLRKFQYFLDNQLKSNVFRAKGILWFNESERRHVFHLAGKRISIDDSEWGEERNNQLVFIGKELDSEKLLSQLYACIEKEQNKSTNRIEV